MSDSSVAVVVLLRAARPHAELEDMGSVHEKIAVESGSVAVGRD